MRKEIWPAATRACITKRIGWLTFRRSFASFLVGRMRHANPRITLELYAQSTMPGKQELQPQVVSAWTPSK
jgi:integrase